MYDYRQFIEFTGIELNPKQIQQYPFVYRRALRRIEEILGWSLTQRMKYEEAGKTSSECRCIDQTMNEEQYEAFIEGLIDPDEEEGVLRIFPFNNLDTNLFIDPAKYVYKVKLVIPTRGDNDQFITIKTFKNWMPKVAKNQFIQYIELCKDDLAQLALGCGCDCTNCALLLIDGDWIRNEFPEELMWVLADQIIWEYQNLQSLDKDSNRIVTSESVSNHSVSYLVTDAEKKGGGDYYSKKSPLDEEYILGILEQYIGPYSPLYKKRKLKVY